MVLLLAGCRNEASERESRQHGEAVRSAAREVVVARAASKSLKATMADGVDYEAALAKLKEARAAAATAKIRKDVIDSAAVLGEAEGRQIIKSMEAFREKWNLTD
jgi:hypothetical protein